ncbi:DUF4249 domain-containing protein [Flagellimonas aquimarina]|uniref:DUF4249 domain-containing protein n=1 Tax=Flagellimonas aquimarina TaxID=2201895 RepID=A0A316L2I9_9FLAO|nr:DUF4249 domain-containing protein [Allomuricauda koreensis]PWL38443.1 DUF4249 domain-containing protein [Allomuricauda koreensis]
MKLYHKTLFIALLFIGASCTDVIDVDVPEGPIRLTIEASLDWEKGTTGNEQTILLSTSTPFFDNQGNTGVTGATVQVTNDNDGSEFVFNDQNNGRYTTSLFVPVLGDTYSLEVIYEGERYTATETLFPVTDISSITQSVDQGEDDEVLEVNVSFEDPADIENYYFLRFQSRNDLLPELFYIKDEFIDGNEATFYYEKIEDEEDNIVEFQPGDIVDITFLSASEDYYNYLQLLIEQFEGAGDPFSPTPVALVGNCINEDNPDNVPYGYFRVTEMVKSSYTFE